MIDIRLDAQWIDYVMIALYFAFVLGVGWWAKRGVSTSIQFFLSGRSLPAWVTGLAFISANLGAVEIMGMSATGAQYGFPTMHYFWVGAIPAMLFLGVVMMPFYYGSKVRSVPEFMRMRFGTGAHVVNSLSFAVAQLLIAGVNLSLLATIVNRLLGWPMWVGLILAAAFVLFYITMGGLTAAIYNEVLQFFVIVAALLPLTLIGLHRVGGWSGLKEKVAADGMLGSEQLHTWPGEQLSGFDNPVLSVIGIVFGLGFVLSFGYWTTNFVEVQRAMASKDLTSARMTPIIGAFPKMFVPFIVIIPGMIAAVQVGEMKEFKQLSYAGDTAAAGATGVKYNDALLLLMRDVCPMACWGSRSPVCWRPSWPGWPRTSRRSTRWSATTSCSST
jgi:SSS family solute:Na+ symporter